MRESLSGGPDDVREVSSGEPNGLRAASYGPGASRGGGRRAVLDGHDVVLAVGAPAFRTADLGPLVPERATVAVVSDDPAEVHRGPATLALLAPPAGVCERLAATLPQRPGETLAPVVRPAPPAAPAEGEPLRVAHVLGELAARLAPEAILVEEAPAVRPCLHRLVPARRPLGLLSAATSGPGFALPAAIGLRLARPDRPVVALLDPAATLSAAQALWTASRHRVGTLFLVLTPAGPPQDRTQSDLSPQDGTQSHPSPRDRTQSHPSPRDRTQSHPSPRDGTQAAPASQDGTPAGPPPQAGTQAASEDGSPPGPAHHDGRAPWPGYTGIDLAALARSLGCPARRVDTHASLIAVFDEVVPALWARDEPLLLDISVGPDS
ncbi:thiamine pyrophosphate-dependent enzyme [Sphaerisporangium aureirubrum]|uniref:thiamine pyrophosphate-dependent enzyme n=1 Tax=Sphaerisporangium aureirubrum TaxID=1544736 RepID=UPI0036280CEE